MLHNINIVEYEKCYPKRLKRYFRQGVQYKTYDKFVPKTENASVGNIPSEIINLFKPEEKEAKIKAFKNLFSETANLIRSIHEEDILDYKYGDRFCIDSILGSMGAEAGKHLKKGLTDILPDGYRADFEYVDYGGFKNVYKFNIKDKNDKKIMHDKAVHVYRKLSEEPNYNYQHGNCAEPNFWVYLSYRAGHPLDKTQFTKHYISDLKSGYTITEFSDKTITKTSNPFDTDNKMCMRYDDVDNNPLLHGKMYDVGGFKKLKCFTDDKMVMRYYKQIASRNTEKEKQQVIAQLEEKIKNPKTPHRNKMAKGIDLYKFKSEYNSRIMRELKEYVNRE